MNAPSATSPRPSQQRKKKTRTKSTNSRPTLAISTLYLHHIDLHPGVESLVCPDCDTWCPITGALGSSPKLVPHHTEPAGTPDARRCTGGSNRRVHLDFSVEEWRYHLMESAQDSGDRHSTSVRRKPSLPATRPLADVRPRPLCADTAYRTYTAHRARCRDCAGRQHCTDGARLADTYVRLLRQDPRRRPLLEFVEQERERAERQQTSRKPARRAASEWASVLPSVERTDAERERGLVGATSTTKPPQLPLEPTHVTRR